jgi:hypothetical protein
VQYGSVLALNDPKVRLPFRFNRYNVQVNMIQPKKGQNCFTTDHDVTAIPALTTQPKPKYLFALFLSPTGDGLKAVFRVPADAEKHLVIGMLVT